MAMVEVAKATVTIVPTMQGAQQTITQELTGAAAPAGTAAGKKAGSNLAAALGSKTKELGKTLTKNVTAPILAVGTASVAAWKSVDAGMDAVAAKTGATGDALTAMQDSVKSIASTIPTSFETAGNAVGEVNTRFGLTGQALEDLSTQFIKFADLNNTDVSSSIDNVQKALSAFGLDAADAAALLDTLNAVGQSTGVSMDSLTNGLIQNGTAFQELGLNVNQSVALMGQLEKSGANSETVMQGLRKALKNAAEDGIPLDQALANLQDTIVNGADSVDGLTAAYDLFGKSGDQIYGAIKNGTLDFTQLGAAALDAGGSVSSAFDETKGPLENFQTVLNQLKIIGADIVASAGPMITSALQTVADVLGKISAAWSTLSPQTQEAIIKAALVAAAIGPVMTIGGKLFAGVGKLIGIIPTLISGIGTVVAALGPVGIAIMAVIGIGVLLIKHWDEVKAFAQNLADNLKQKWENIKQATSAAVQSVAQKFSEMKQNVLNKWEELKRGAQEKFEAIKQKIVAPIETAKEKIRNAIEAIKGFFNVKLSFPHINLPHFHVNGGQVPWGLGGKGSPPSISIDWYAKAMDNAMILNGPTIFGMQNGRLLGGGEAGSEVVAGASNLMGMIRSSVRAELADDGGSSSDSIVFNIYGAPGQSVDAIADAVAQKLYHKVRRKGAYA